MCLTSFPVFHTYGITFHTGEHPLFHIESLPYGIWNMDRKPDGKVCCRTDQEDPGFSIDSKAAVTVYIFYEAARTKS